MHSNTHKKVNLSGYPEQFLFFLKIQISYLISVLLSTFPISHLFFFFLIFFFLSSSIFAYSYILMVNRIRFSERDLNKMISLLLCQLVPSHTCSHTSTGTPTFTRPGKNLMAVGPIQKRFRNCTTVGNGVSVYMCVSTAREKEQGGGERIRAGCVRIESSSFMPRSS